MRSSWGVTGGSRFRLMLVGIGLLVVISLVAVSLLGVFRWFDASLQETVDRAVREAIDVDFPVAVEEALRETLERFDLALREAVAQLSVPTEAPADQMRGGPRQLSSPPSLPRADAILLVKFNISMMTRRYSADTIGDTQPLQDVDINTLAKVEYLKGRLAASVRANLGGSLDETRFQTSLQLRPASSVEDAGRGLQRAYRAAWSAN